MMEKIKKIVHTIGEIVYTIGEKMGWFVGLCFFAGGFILFVYIGDKIRGSNSLVAWGGWGKVFLKALTALVAMPIIIVLVIGIFVFVMSFFPGMREFGRKEKREIADDDDEDGSSG